MTEQKTDAKPSLLPTVSIFRRVFQEVSGITPASPSHLIHDDMQREDIIQTFLLIENRKGDAVARISMI